MITVTEAARSKAAALRENEGQSEDAVLRVGVQGGGCSGFQYSLEFGERRDDDTLLAYPEITVAVDPFSGPLIAGSILDYDGSISGQGFHFTNPQVSAGCGCGKSFQVNEDALEALS
jgi:iron-sulfur cluster assembly accessory protein